MSLLSENNPILANGDYEVQLWAGYEYLFTCKAPVYDSGVLTFQVEDDDGVMQDVDGAVENGTGPMEYRITATSSGIVNINVASKAGSSPIPITITRVKVR